MSEERVPTVYVLASPDLTDTTPLVQAVGADFPQRRVVLIRSTDDLGDPGVLVYAGGLFWLNPVFDAPEFDRWLEDERVLLDWGRTYHDVDGVL